MMLHDLPENTARAALSEMCRVCASDGRIGLIELPLINDERPVSADFWQELVTDAGLEIETVRTLPWPGGEGDYTVVVATPAE
jgi:ubiquinone/menaquinone biosynthesis C-methylase UbiE